MAKNYTAKEAIEVIIKNEDAAAVLDVTRRFSSRFSAFGEPFDCTPGSIFVGWSSAQKPSRTRRNDKCAV